VTSPIYRVWPMLEEEEAEQWPETAVDCSWTRGGAPTGGGVAP
jgi:hypothetical protein